MKKQNTEEDYFSLRNLDKLAEIDGHMSFIEELVGKYSSMPQGTRQTGAGGSDWSLIQEQLGLIRKKMNEKKLNISVIGEFSTGKSTFINALLRKELLASSALQGTTVASTVIDYGSQYGIHLEYLDGRKDEKLTYPAFADLKDDLDRYTTEPAVAKLLKTVRVYLPSEILKDNFRIIDTPGTNVTEAWHEDVTVRALQSDSDLSIILISAEKPVPETMLKFAEKNLTSILPQCIFVVTKLDLIRKRERVQVLSYVKMKLEEELGLKDAVVLPYISPSVLDSQVPDEERYVKRRNICILGEIGVGKKTLAETLLGERIFDSGSIFSLVPMIKISHGQKPVVRFRLHESEKLLSECLQLLPLKLQNIIKRHHGVDLPEIETDYNEFCKVFMQDENYCLLHTVAFFLPLMGMKSRHQITICGLTDGSRCRLNDICFDIMGMTDIIMVLNADHPLSGDEKHFIERLIMSFGQEKIIFAVNKMDMIGSVDMPKVKEYVEKTLSSMVSAPRICYISASLGEAGIAELTQMMEIDPESGMREESSADEELLKLSLETERKLVEHTVNQKTLAITKKLATLIDNVYASISRKMEQISGTYEERLELLNRSSKTDLSVFVRQEKPARLRHFDEAAKKVMDDMDALLEYAIDSAKEEILGKLDEKGSIELMKTYISNTLGCDCSVQAVNMISQADIYYGQIRGQFKKEMEAYNNAFKKNYETLNIIPVDMTQSKYNLPGDIKIETADISSTANYIAEKLSSENKAFFGGAAAGAAVGTAIAPGVGTLIGGLVGFFAGGGLAPDTATVRKECKDKLRPQLTSYYGSVRNKITSALEQFIKQIRRCLDDEIDGYLTRYKREVERLIAEENSQKFAVQSEIQELNAERNQIRNRKNQLESVMLQLNHFGRKEN